MKEFKNTFLSGKMNKDLDSRVMPDGQYRDALNIKLGSSSGSDVGALENVLSNEALTTLSLGSIVNTIGAYFDSTADMIYWFVNSDTGNYVIEYDTISNTPTIVLEDTSVGVLNFSTSNLITGVGIIVDSDNDRRILIWTDDLNPIRSINIETAKGYLANGFNSSQISLIKRPPFNPPDLTLATTPSEEENNLAERFLRFAYRYRYADGEISALSPFTETAFLPKTFQYDYSISSNESMVNQYNEATIGFNVGVSSVIQVDIVMKESNSETVYLIESFDKEEESWPDNSNQSFIFTNNKIYTALASDQLKRLYDSVPISAKALEIIGNRLIIGNYTEGYNIEDSSNNAIKIDFSVDYDRGSVLSGTPSRTMKSNRGYEVGIVYLDDDGRMTTVLTSPTNTKFIPNADCNRANKLEVTLVNIPPAWATRYRFFLKQTSTDYETIVPSIFYQDGVYVWVKVEADERNKIEEGDFIYIKSDSTEILDKALQTRVLEIVDQPVNFLDLTETINTLQIPGWYFKIKPTGFRLNESDFQTYSYTGFAFRSRSTDNNITVASGASGTYYELPIYYGSTGINDASVTGTYTGTTDIRYIVEISSLGTPDSFRWSNDGGSNYSSEIPITGSAQTIENGIQVTFSNTTGHDTSDSWIISAKSISVSNEWNKAGDNDGASGSLKRRAVVAFAGKPLPDESIKAGSTITITYDDTSSDSNVDNQLSFTQTFNSTSDYDNIEEWFFGDNIINVLTYPNTLDRVLFRRGTQFKLDPPQQVSIDGRYTGLVPNNSMIMIFASSANYGGSGSIRVDTGLNILSLTNNIIFETIPTVLDESLFYEIGRTYEISSGFHQGFDGNDTNQTSIQDAILLLPVFNAFSWGNGFESYKIKDRFNEKSMLIDTRPSLDIENYRQNKRIADLTYSKSFEQSTNFNGINEFNLSTGNFLLMDDKYGSIQKLFSADTNLEVYQEDKVHTVLFEKDVLFDASGNGTIREVTNILGKTPIPWTGEYGISTHPESHSYYGNIRYWSDVRRGTLLKKSNNGISEIQSGMKDFFRDSFRDNPTTRKFGAYDLHNKEYVFYDEGQYTIAYDESVKGFPSFYSFQPQWMGSLNNNFYSFFNGQLYRHYDESNPVRNNFYGTDYNSTVKLIVSKGPSEIKVMKNVILEGNKPWDTTITSYLNDEMLSITRSSISSEEYSRKEGKLYAYVRRNEITGELTAKSSYGIGEISLITGFNLIFSYKLPASISIGDSIYNNTSTFIGQVSNINRTSNTITLDSTAGLSIGDFIYGQKDGRVEGSEIRGYNFEIDLIDDSNTRTELFAVGTNMFKSWPS